MTLPKSISPNPLFISTIELRFVTSLNRLELFQKMFSQFSKVLPIVEEANVMPQDLKNQDENLRYLPDFTFKNDDFLLSFSTRSVSFENISEYKLWPTYFSFVKECLTEMFKMNFISAIDRCGVRYGSVFDGVINPELALKEVPKMNVDGNLSILDAFKAVYHKEERMLYLQISPNAKIQKNDIVRIGLYIDIDASFTRSIVANEDVFEIFEKLHFDQKELFFGLLKDEFIQTLNPQY